MSEEAREADANLKEIERLRAQAADLRAALECLLDNPTDAAKTRARAALRGSGQAPQSELGAARAVVWAAREAEFTTVALGLALRNYDKTTKARGE